MKNLFVLVVLLLSAATLCGQEGKTFSTENLFRQEGVTYAKAGTLELKLDVIWPKGEGPFPALIYFFGSGWGYWPAGRSYCSVAARQAAERGYVAVQADYRQTTEKVNGIPKYRFPDQIHDAKAVVRWLRANAARYHVDADHIGAIGFSSGAHLALMLGLTSEGDGLEGTLGNTRYSSRVQAVVSCAGPIDLTQYYPNEESRAAIRDFLGAPIQSNPEAYRQASPITYARADAPPILIIHGDSDPEIPLAQAQLIDARLEALGTVHKLVIKRSWGHADFSTEPEVLAFMDEQLKK